MDAVPQGIADEVIAVALATISALERELDKLQAAASESEQGRDVAAYSLIKQAEALVAEAHEYRAKVREAARAEATAIINASPATRNGQG